MTLEQIEERLNKLSNRIDGINTWIKNNPGVTDPNVYEIIDCNVQYAECVAELVAYYNEFGWPEINEETGDMMLEKSWPRGARVADLPHLHPALANCFLGLHTMETLREFPIHPFIQQKEPYEMYSALRMRQLAGTYTLGKTEEDRRIKREVICKSMSVPFYIWQVHRTEPDYQYDNEGEFNGMKDMFALYEASEEPCQFKTQITNLFNKIDANYKYKITKQDEKASQKEKK